MKTMIISLLLIVAISSNAKSKESKNKKRTDKLYKKRGKNLKSYCSRYDLLFK